MKKRVFAIILATVLITAALCLSGCTDISESDTAFWFSEHSSEFVAYDETANGGSGNLSSAGTFYHFTSAKDQTITMAIAIEHNMFTSVYCFVGDKQVKSESDVGVYSFVYKDVVLKKGDKIKLHHFATSVLQASESKIEIQLMVINGFSITEFNHLGKA